MYFFCSFDFVCSNIEDYFDVVIDKSFRICFEFVIFLFRIITGSIIIVVIIGLLFE